MRYVSRMIIGVVPIIVFTTKHHKRQTADRTKYEKPFKSQLQIPYVCEEIWKDSTTFNTG